MKQAIITIMFVVAIALLMAESEDIPTLLMTKAVAFVIGYAAWRLCDATLLHCTNDEEA